MPNLADQLNDIAVVRAILLQQLATSIAKDVSKQYLLILDDIKSKILNHDTLDNARVKKIIKEIKSIVYPSLEKQLYSPLVELSIQERDFIISSTNSAVGANIFSAVPPDSVVVAIGNAPIMEGAVVKSWFNGLNDKMSFDFERSIKLSLLKGESTQEATKRLSSIMGISLNQAETLARTAIADVTNRVRDEVYRDNNDVVKGVEFVATLDGKTTISCAIRDSALYSINDHKPLNQKARENVYQPCPRHPRCRSIYISILKSWEELGIDIKEEIPIGTRASMDGQVSTNTSFADWLKTKDEKFVTELLGKGRAQLYLDGKISIGDLVTKNGKSLTLAELNAKYK